MDAHARSRAVTPVLKAAHAYAGELGWAVLPCRGKAPAVPKEKGGRGYLDATRDHDAIDRLWRRYRPDSVGIACKPSGLFGLDVDPRDDGDETLAAIERKHDELSHTVRQLSGGGGEHILFLAPVDLDPVGSLGPGLQIKYLGYIIAAPSLHEKTRRPYAWSVDHHPLEVSVADPPEWLLTLLRKPVVAHEAKPWPGFDGHRLAPRVYTAIERACEAICGAPFGEQEATLNRHAFFIGRLTVEGCIPADLAFRVLAWAAARMANAPGRQPWLESEVQEKIARAFADAAKGRAA